MFQRRGVGDRGQSILEYAILLTVLCAVFVTMIVYMKSSVRAKWRIVENQINEAVSDSS